MLNLRDIFFLRTELSGIPKLFIYLVSYVSLIMSLYYESLLLFEPLSHIFK